MSAPIFKDHIDEIEHEVKQLVDVNKEYIKLYSFKIMAKVLQKLVVIFVLVGMFLGAFFFLSLAAGFYIGELLGDTALGFAIIGAPYLLAGIVIFVKRKKLFESAIIKTMSQIFFNSK